MALQADQIWATALLLAYWLTIAWASLRIWGPNPKVRNWLIIIGVALVGFICKLWGS